MNISRLKITGFKSLRHFEIEEVPNFLVLTGPNGSGKSAVLEAIGLVKDHVGSYANQRSRSPHLVNAACANAAVEISVTLSDPECRWLREQGLDVPDPHAPTAITAQISREEVHVKASPAVERLFRTYAPERGLGVFAHFSPMRRVRVDGTSSVEFDPGTARRSNEGGMVFNGREDFRDTMQMLATRVLDDFLHNRQTQENRDSLVSVYELFRRLFPGKVLLPPRVVRPNRIGFMVKTTDGEHPFSMLSAGEQEIFVLLATLQTIALGRNIVLYDTPEAHLNAALERVLPLELQRLSTNGSQFIVATHSLEFIDGVPLDALWRVGTYSDSNQAERIADEGQKIRAFESMGIRVGLQLASQTVVFVEGDSDPELLRRLLPDLPSTVTIVPGNGVKSVLGVAEFSMRLLEDGTKYSRFFCIRDRDYMTPEDREKSMGARPHLLVLDRYHIENYLLDPEAISKVIADTQPDDRRKSPDQVQKALQAIAEELRDEAIAGWVAYQLNDKIAKHHVGAGGAEPLAALRASAASVAETLRQGFAAAEDLIGRRRSDIDARRPMAWKHEFPGRQLLRRFVDVHCCGVGATPFMNLVASAVGCDRTRTEGLRSVLRPLLP